MQQARCADLFVATRPYGAAKAAVWPDLVEAEVRSAIAQTDGSGLLLGPGCTVPRMDEIPEANLRALEAAVAA